MSPATRTNLKSLALDLLPAFILGVILILPFVLSGCSNAHLGDEPAPGIYMLTIEGEADGCQPLRATGAMGEVAVIRDYEGEEIILDLPAPEILEGSSPVRELEGRVRLSSANGYHLETNLRVPDCEGGYLHQEWTLLPGNDGRFEVRHLQEWGGLAACGSVDMPQAPIADCSAERRLRYALRSVCEAPCGLVLTTEGTRCACR